MTTLNKSEILKISHEIARMVGYNEFPTILSKLWKNRNIEYKEYPSRKHKLPLLEGVINSIDLYITLLNVGSKIGFKDNSYYIIGTDFCLEKFETGKVFLTSKSIAYIEILLYEKALKLHDNILTREQIVSFFAKYGEGVGYTKDGGIETTSGLFIPSIKGYSSLYRFTYKARDTFGERRSGKVKNAISELSIQSSMISFWNVLSKSTSHTISVDYEVGVISGKKAMIWGESRYDLIININGSVQLIELKKSIIDIGVIHHKIGKMKMGLSYPEDLPECTDYSVIFIGKKISDPVMNMNLLFDSEKIKIETYGSYIEYMAHSLNHCQLNRYDRELAHVYLSELKQKVRYAGNN